MELPSLTIFQDSLPLDAPRWATPTIESWLPDPTAMQAGKVPAPRGAGLVGNEGYDNVIRTEGGARRRLGPSRATAPEATDIDHCPPSSGERGRLSSSTLV